MRPSPNKTRLRREAKTDSVDLTGPRYILAMCVNVGMVAMALIAATTLRLILVRLNRKLEQGIFVEGAINSGTNEAGKKGFRFRI